MTKQGEQAATLLCSRVECSVTFAPEDAAFIKHNCVEDISLGPRNILAKKAGKGEGNCNA